MNNPELQVICDLLECVVSVQWVSVNNIFFNCVLPEFNMEIYFHDLEENSYSLFTGKELI